MITCRPTWLVGSMA